MIKSEILKTLSVITKEEQFFLSGSKDIDRNFYMISADNVVNSGKFLVSGARVAMRPHARFVHFPKHRHDYIEIVYMCSGHTTHIINGKTLMLAEGDLLIMGTDVTQEILPAGKNDIAVNFILRQDFFEDIISSFPVNLPMKSAEYLHFSTADLLPAENLIENLMWLLVSSTHQRTGQCRFTLGLLFMTLLNNADKSEDSASLGRVFTYIEENYKDGSLSELADMLHYDFSWLSREIKKKTGKTYTDLVQEKRLSEACFLLRNTDMNISDISVSIGYCNISYFHRLFGKTFGMSPYKYRMLP